MNYVNEPQILRQYKDKKKINSKTKENIMNKFKKPSFHLPLETLRTTDEVSKPNYFNHKQSLQEEKISLDTKINFMKEVDAFTLGNLNLIVGRTGKGKTDLAITMVADNLIKGHAVAIYISEGLISDYYKQLELLLKTKLKEESVIDSYMSKLMILSPLEHPTNSVLEYDSWCKKLFSILKDNKVQLLYFDNLTTSSFSNSTPEIESGFLRSLATEAKKYQICVTGLIHTTKTLNPFSEIKIEDIRGNSANSNLATNIFAFNNFDRLDKGSRIIKLIKSRDYGEKVGFSFDLTYKKLKFRGFYGKTSKISEIASNRYFLQNYKQKLSGPNQARS